MYLNNRMSQKRLWSFLANSCILTLSYIVKIGDNICMCFYQDIYTQCFAFSAILVLSIFFSYKGFSLTTILTCINSFNANCLFLIAVYKIGAYNFLFPYFLLKKYFSEIATPIIDNTLD